MSDREETCLVMATLALLACVVVVVALADDEQQPPAVGFEQDVHPAEPRVSSPPSSSRERTEPDGRFLSPAEAGEPSPRPQATAPASTDGASAGVLPRDLAPGMLPTAEGLYLSTAELWSQPEFLHAIDSSLLDLPTMDDCRGAVSDPCTLELLTRAQALTIELAMLAGAPEDRRGPAFTKALETVARMAEVAERDLMRRLDGNGSNGYSRWTEMRERYQEWAR